MFLGLSVAGCVGQDAPTAEIPSLREYAAACERALGPLPAIDCDGSAEVPIPVTEHGAVRLAASRADLEAGERCDAPSIITGCAPGSRAGSSRNAEGSVFHWVCRVDRDADPGGGYDDVALIGHQPATGAACFFGVPADDRRRPGQAPVPGSDEDLRDAYWGDLRETAVQRCRDCHDNDPIVVTPWLWATGVVDNDPLAPFELVGQEWLEAIEPGAWLPARELAHPDAAPCTRCHRLTNRLTCDLAREATGAPPALASEAARVFPLDRWMDSFDRAELVRAHPTAAAWEADLGVAAATVDACCAGELPLEACWVAR